MILIRPSSLACLVGILVCLHSAPAMAREWKDASGKFKVEASLVRIVEDKVELKKSDGTTIQVPVARLCDEDQQYLESLKKKSALGSLDPAVAALEEPCRVQAQGLQLGDFLRALREDQGISICAGWSIRNPASLEKVIDNKPQNDKVRDVLIEVLQPLGLAWYEIDGTLVVVPEQESANVQSTRVYRCRNGNNVKDLYRQIVSTVAPETWASAGGTGSIQPYPGESLVITNTLFIHQVLDDQLSDNLVRIRGQIAGDKKKPSLDQQVKTEFEAVPLRRALEMLGEQSSLSILLDPQELQTAGVSSDEPVTLNAGNAKLSVALKLLLQPLGLRYALQDDGSIKIISRDSERRLMRSQSYGVQPLVSVTLGNGQKGIDASSLIQVVQSIDPASWDVNGGQGSVQYTPSGQLEVNQTSTAHSQIQQLIADLLESTKSR